MFREFLRRLQASSRSPSPEDGHPRVLDPISVLNLSHRYLRRLAEQIDDHAAKAPYPHVTERLRQIVLEKRKSLGALREKILSLQGHLEEAELNVKSGKNHWERMVQDLQDQKALGTLLTEQSVRLAEEAPEISSLLKDIAEAQASHGEILIDLVARADPQANQS